MAQDDAGHRRDINVFSASPRVRSQRIASASGIHGASEMCRVANFSKATPS
jgi:hypothetical protein